MHRLLPPDPRPQNWAPRLSPMWVRLFRPIRMFAQRWVERIHRVEFRGLEQLKSVIDTGAGVLITPNHCTYSDPYLLYDAVDRLGTAAYFMTAWQVFGRGTRFKQYLLQKHGAFTIDRDGADRQAFRTAIEILQTRREPLVVFPEGEMYHLGDQVTPFQEGAAAIACAAVRKSDRPVVCLPCALKYYPLVDPRPHCAKLLDKLESTLLWKPRPDLSLVQRIYRLAEGVLSLKEIERVGTTSAGPLPERLAALSEHVLDGLESRHKLSSEGRIPQRVKRVRGHLVHRLSESSIKAEAEQLAIDLDEVFFVIQLFSYPGDYVSRRPTWSRICETLEKLEEDILQVPLARSRVPLGAIVAFGEPIPVNAAEDKRDHSAQLTMQLEQSVQSLLDSIHVSEPLKIEQPQAEMTT